MRIILFSKIFLFVESLSANNSHKAAISSVESPSELKCFDTSFDSLREILRQLEREDKEIILCGDTNCDFKDPKN